MFDLDQCSIPESFASAAPGPVLSAWLSVVDRSQMNGYDLVNLAKAQARLVAYAEAELAATIRELAFAAPGDETSPPERIDEVDELTADELRAALHLTRSSANRTLSDALELVDRLPRVWEALHEGDIDARRARTITIGTEHLNPEMSREVAEKALERAPSQTTGQLAARLRRLCIDHNPEDAGDRYQAALTERKVTSAQTPDGTANLFGIDLPPDRVSAARHRIDSLARQLRGPDEFRTMDQLRADVYLDLLTGEALSENGKSGRANITIDLKTLAKLDERAGEIPGIGPVIADIARQTAEQAATWEFRVHDPESGDIVATGTTRRRPTTGQARNVRAGNSTCIFPGCRMPATDCDLDHTIDHAKGGPTTETNLAPACRHDHNLKHHGKWNLRRLSNGDYEWTSPHGHIYINRRGPPR